MGMRIHQGVPVTLPWVGTFVSQIQSRPQPLGKLPQLLHVVGPVLKPTSCTLQLSMGPPVTYQPGTPASQRLQTPGAQLPTQLHSWSYNLDREAPHTRQPHQHHPLPHTSSKEAPSPYHTQGLEVTWMWDPKQCTEPWQNVPSSLRLSAPFPQAGSPLIPLAPSPSPNGCLRSVPTPLVHTFILFPPPLASKLRQSCWESSWGQLPLPSSHLGVNGETLPDQMGPHTSTPTSWEALITMGESCTNLFSGSEYFVNKTQKALVLRRLWVNGVGPEWGCGNQSFVGRPRQFPAA